MNKIKNYSFHDSTIQEISIRGDELWVVCRLWNTQMVELAFRQYCKAKCTYSNEDIDELVVSKESLLLEEAIKDKFSDGESGNRELLSYSFVSSWSETNVLEIIAPDVIIRSLDR